MIFLPVCLTRSRIAARVFELVALIKQFSRETENPKVFGCFSNSRFNSVDFPVPDGPEITMGRNPTLSVNRTAKLYAQKNTLHEI